MVQGTSRPNLHDCVWEDAIRNSYGPAFVFRESILLELLRPNLPLKHSLFPLMGQEVNLLLHSYFLSFLPLFFFYERVKLNHTCRHFVPNHLSNYVGRSLRFYLYFFCKVFFFNLLQGNYGKVIFFLLFSCLLRTLLLFCILLEVHLLLNHL